MAKKEIVVRYDDVDGTELGDGEGATFQFTVDGQSYQLDLSEQHHRQFKADIGFWTSRATPIVHASSLLQRRRERRTRNAESRRESAAIRNWWATHPKGLPKFTSHGRIPSEVKAAYPS